MLSVRLQGGLGNQLWQTACAQGVAEATGRTLVFATEATPPSAHSTTDYFQGVLKPWAAYVPNYIGMLYREQSVRQEDISGAVARMPAHIPVLLDGYFQNYKYIPESFCPRLRAALPAPPPLPSTAAFLHVRGGDYVHHWFHDVGLNKASYYERAIALFPPDTVFYLFTNDKEYAEAQPWLDDLYGRVVWQASAVEEQALAAMAACPRGGICPNSTFSWWAAYICSRAQAPGTYVLPSAWFNDPAMYVEGYFFPEAKVLTV